MARPAERTIMSASGRSACFLFVGLAGGAIFLSYGAEQNGKLENDSAGTLSIALQITPGGANRVNPAIEIANFPDFLTGKFVQSLSADGAMTFPVCIYGDGQESYVVDTTLMEDSRRYFTADSGEAIAFDVSVGVGGAFGSEALIRTVMPTECDADSALDVEIVLSDAKRLSESSRLSGSLELLLRAQ